MPACAPASGWTPHGNDETTYLAPLDRAVASGLAPADELLAKWQGEWKGSFVPLFRDHAY